MKTVLIGAGNVATQLGKALHEANYRIIQVYSRTEASASMLAARLGTTFTADPAAIADNADLYLFCVKDDAIVPILSAMPVGAGLYIHTAGSVPMGVFSERVERYGVLYPLQTFSKARDLSFREIPLLLEAAREEDAWILAALAGKLSDTVHFITSEKRKYLHLAAVFACNFTNHIYALAAEIVESEGMDWALLQPLISETAAKAMVLPPSDAQTGPAVRGDYEVMQKHLEWLKDDRTKDIYRMLSESIHANSLKERKG